MRKDIDDPRREFLITALSLGLFGGANLASLFQAGYARGDMPDELPPGRSIYRLRGSVTVDGSPASIETQVKPGSLVRTGRKSSVIFVVAEDAFILRSNSELQLQSGGGAIIEGMRMLSGKLLSVFGRREKPHTITTTTATIGIRGTGIYVESEPDRSYVCTCYGMTRVTANADPDTRVDVVAEHHDEPLYVLQSPSRQRLIVPAPVINHTDRELALIEGLVGRTTPFAFAGGGYEGPRRRNY